MTQFTIPEGSGDVILTYARTKSREWPTARMVERVADAVAVLEAAARAVPDDVLDWQAPHEEEGWTAASIIGHVTGINANTASRCLVAASAGAEPAEQRPPLPAAREACLDAHRAVLEEVFAGLTAVPEDAHIAFTWEHPLLGPLNWREWLLTIRPHCLAHAAQLDAIRAAAETA
jgi:hypothetical protein